MCHGAHPPGMHESEGWGHTSQGTLPASGQMNTLDLKVQAQGTLKFRSFMPFNSQIQPLR